MLKKALQKVAKLIGRQKKTSVGSLFTKGTGRLKRSIKEKVAGDDKKGYRIVSEMLDYGYYQDSGVRGSSEGNYNNRVSANKDSLYRPGQFSPTKKVIGGPLPFAARYVIRREGLLPKPFIKPSVNKVMNQGGLEILAQGTADEMAEEIVDNLKNATLVS